ncbi:unnamed protein product [Prorocentrum cordatum]|uniref:Uncharacterized protein n=1 Tax=Prorocentrum cordatum TaxID=2364126 RepID=A0ABN9YH24_9DINO|nr:unnamed protein product [Polarella glacialis]
MAEAAELDPLEGIPAGGAAASLDNGDGVAANTATDVSRTVPNCPKCEQGMLWSDFSGPPYDASYGWGCVKVEDLQELEEELRGLSVALQPVPRGPVQKVQRVRPGLSAHPGGEARWGQRGGQRPKGIDIIFLLFTGRGVLDSRPGGGH